MFSNTLAKRMDNVSKKLKPNKVMLSNLMKTFDEENRHIIGRGNYEKYGERTEGTLWTAYQAATAWSTHVSKANTRVLREDKVRKMMDSTQWKELENV
jgi:23S rRNA maturation mini-RNase III